MTLYQGEPSYRNLKPDEVIPQVADVRCTKCGHEFPIRVGLWHNREAELVAQLAAAVARATQAEGERDRLRAALILANQILYEHHNVYLPRTELGYPCQVCKNSKVFTVIDAALAAPQTDAKGE